MSECPIRRMTWRGSAPSSTINAAAVCLSSWKVNESSIDHKSAATVAGTQKRARKLS